MLFLVVICYRKYFGFSIDNKEKRAIFSIEAKRINPPPSRLKKFNVKRRISSSLPPNF